MIHINNRQLSMGTHCYAQIYIERMQEKTHQKNNKKNIHKKRKMEIYVHHKKWYYEVMYYLVW